MTTPDDKPRPSAGQKLDPEATKAIVKDLGGSFKGRLLQVDDGGYDEARRVWNGMVDKRPALIAQCADADDIALVVRAARQRGALTSIRGGGHSVAGRALCDGGVTIDLRQMRRTVVDRAEGIARVQGGSLLGDVDAVCAQHGVVVPAGIVSETGVAGLALGGGGGWLSRTFGMTCDHIASVDLVSAEGELLRVDDTSHPDLMWALRGAGHNFGVVAEFRFRTHEFPSDLRFAMSIYTPDQAVDALNGWVDIYKEMPNEISSHAILKQGLPPLPFFPEEAHGQPALLIVALYVGDPSDGASSPWLDRLTSVGAPIARVSDEIPFAFGLQRFIDVEVPNGLRYYTKEANIEDLPPPAIDQLVEGWMQLPMAGEIEIMGMGGAVSETPADFSAFAHRNHHWWFNFAMQWEDAAQDADHIAQIRAAVDALSPWLAPGIYANMLNADESDRVVDAYGGLDRYRRLAKIKAIYDPDNFFRVNANIVPQAR